MTIIKLAKIAQVSAGQGAPQGDNNFGSEGIPFIKAGNLEDLIITNDEYKTCKLVNKTVAQEYKLKLHPKGTLVFAKSGMSAAKSRVFCLNNESYVVNHLATVLPDSALACSQFLKYYFIAIPPSRLIKDEAYPSISLSDINNIEIPLPLLEEQKRIVRELDAADVLREKRKQAIALLDEYLKAIFLDMFGDPMMNPKGWKKQSLGEVVTVQSGQVDPKLEPYASMIHIGGADIESGTGKIINKITAKEARQISGKYIFDENYLLYSKIRPYLNKVSLPDFKGICSADIYPIRPKENFRKGFLAFILKSKAFLEHAEKNSGRANIPKINRPDLLKFQVIVPPVLEQEKFENIWFKVDLLKQSMLAQSQELDANFKALIQKTFNE